MARHDSAAETVEQRTPRRVRAARQLPAVLHVVHPPELVTTVALGKETLVVGRRPGAADAAAAERELRLDHPTVSRRHFAIGYDAARRRHLGRDLGSRNGSRVDGRFVDASAPRPLVHGAVLRIGDALAVYECGPDVEAPDPEVVDRTALPGASAAMRQLRTAVHELARDPAPVLLLGETGTGKEFVAREIHRLSGRRGPMLAINCAALARELVESQLFGHARGAFTGAHTPTTGLFRAAEGGSLLLDEIGELPLDLQPKLLRALEESEVQPVGDTRPVRIDVRVLAATLQPLGALARAGRFRLDLYARLALWEVAVPPLRERRSDVLEWVARLRARFFAERGQGAAPPLELDADVCERLLLATWPDNLRGLSRFVHRVAQHGGHEIEVSDLDAWLGPTAAGDPSDPDGDITAPEVAGAAEAVRAATEAAAGVRPSQAELERVLAATEGSVRATAKHFGRDRRQIYRWLEHYGLRASKG
ncbi:MAG: sigma 54-interacting transcriptional regulator [Myxococcales bacterium]|nr:sigma 54-interacting transcriptional regulator [Myxococcales bacterium]